MYHVLASLYRTGSTAFMRGCRAGGMHVVVADDPDDQTTPWRAALMEPAPAQVGAWGFPRMHPDGSAIKMLRPKNTPTLAMLVHALAVIPDGGYRLAFSWRHPLEIRTAYEQDFDWAFRRGVPAHATLPWCVEGKYERAMGRMVEHYRNRRDVHSVLEFQYRSNYRADLPSLEHDALDIFSRLAEQGWPLDPVKAAAEIDVARHCRWKAEELVA